MTTSKPLPEEAVTAIADFLVNQSDEPWPSGTESDRLHYWRDKAIEAASSLRKIVAMRATTQPTAMPEEEVMRRALSEIAHDGQLCADEYGCGTCQANVERAQDALSIPIPLKPKVDEDAEWLRSFAEYVGGSIGEKAEKRLERIAARLEDGHAQ